MKEPAADNLDLPTGGSHSINQVIADTASDAIITIDEKTTILFVNRATEKIFGYSQAELLGQSVTMLMPDYLRQVHRTGIESYLKTGQRHISWEAIEMPGLHKNGNEIPLELSFGELIENGVRYFTGIARDITDRKESELALRQREDYFRELLENATDIITVLNQEGTRNYISPSVERSLGYPPDELLARDPFELVHPDDVSELRRLFTSEIKIKGAIGLVEYRIRHKDGSWRTHELTARQLHDGSVVTGTVVNARDVTERKRLERRLTAQYRAARILAEAKSLSSAAPDLLKAVCESLGWELGQIWIADPDAQVLRWLASWHVPSIPNTEFEEASRGRTFKRGVGFPGRVWEGEQPEWVSDITSDSNFPRTALAARVGLKSAVAVPVMIEDRVSAVIEFLTRDQQAPDQMLIEMMIGIGSQLGQFIERERAQKERTEIFHRELRARQEVEAAIDRMARVQTVTDIALSHLSLDRLLAELLDRVRDAMDVDTVVILLLEDENELVAWATKGLELDVKIRVPLGVGFAGRIAAQKSPMVIDDIATADLYTPFLRQRGVKSLLGVPLLVEGRVVGVIHVGRLVCRPFTDDDTRLLQLVAFRVALAIDNARLYEEERAARRDAETASRSKDEFLTIISHELRTPLTPVIGWIHMIRNGILPAKETEHGLLVIEKNSHSLKRLINDLLDMSAILSGKMRMEEVPVRLGPVLREAIETVQPLADAREIKIELTFRDWQDELVRGDRARLVQVFWNVLNNAIKFSGPSGLVRIDCAGNGKDAIVNITDSGQGITADFLPFVFERFRQADGSKTRSYGGLGLGLALVKSFVEAHHGTVEVSSAGPGAGTCFTVRLPRGEGEPESAGESQRPQTESEAQRAHILLIEDDDDTLEILRATFKAQGFRVTACESAAAALEIGPKSFADLIISDIGMPTMDGFELMRQLRQMPELQTTPAIALTGYAARNDAEMAIDAGFNAHVAKPVDPGELLTLVDQMLKATIARSD